MWKARNGFRFDSHPFSVDAVIFRVVSDIRLVGSVFGFKPSQLRGVMSSQLADGLRVIASPRRPIRVVSWKQPPLGAIKLTVDGCSRGNLGLSAAGGVLRDHRGMVLAGFGSFLGHQPILYAELVAVCEGLELAVQLGYSIVEVESDSATVVSWVLSGGSVRWDYTLSLRRVRYLVSSHSIVVRHVFREATYAADFLANWACSSCSSRRFFSVRDLPTGLSGILHMDTHAVPHIRR